MPMTTAEAPAPPALLGIAPDVLRWVRLSIERNHGRPVQISAQRIADAFGCSLRTAERVPAALHAAGVIVFERPRWNPDSAYDSVHHMPGRFSLPVSNPRKEPRL